MNYGTLTPAELRKKIKEKLKNHKHRTLSFFLNDVIKKQYGDNTIDKNCAALNYSSLGNRRIQQCCIIRCLLSNLTLLKSTNIFSLLKYESVNY